MLNRALLNEACVLYVIIYDFINALISVNNTGCSKSPDTISNCFYEITAKNILTRLVLF